MQKNEVEEEKSFTPLNKDDSIEPGSTIIKGKYILIFSSTNF